MRRALALLSVAWIGTFAGWQTHAAPAFEIEETTIAKIHAAMRARQLTCHDLVSAYLERIAANDKKEPPLNAIVATSPNALAEADALDAKFKKSGLTGPLHCIPAIVKDNFETVGLQSANGSITLKGFVSSKDAFLVARIKDAGAIVLAKSNMAEWAFSPIETVNSILGTTRNPYDVNRVPAGSSGGTAAAVASNFGAIGLGSDTGNSIRGPSSHASLVGIRSTMGLTSRAGVIPLSYLADIAGPMTRTVEDAARVFQVIVGEDPEDPVTTRSHGRKIPDYLKALNKNALKGARIGVLHQAYERTNATVDPEIVQVFMKALEDMRAAGAIIVDPATVTLPQNQPGGGATCRGFKYDLNEYLATRGQNAPVHSYDEILNSPVFAQIPPSIQQRFRQSGSANPQGPESDACKSDAASRAAYGAAVTKTMDEMKLTAFVYPTWSQVPRLISEPTRGGDGDNSQTFSPRSGFPAINVPMGFTRNNTLPIGMTIYGRAWDEATLIGLAYAFEQKTHHRHKPPAVAQSIGITGYVGDATGAALPGVVALAMPQRGGDTRTVVSGTNGTYTFEDLSEGIYRIDFDLPGFDVTRRNLVPVRAGETTRVDVTLQVSAICECIGKAYRLDQASLTVHMGQVVDRSGRPLPRAQLEIVGPGGPETIYASREGRFQVRLPSARQKWPLTARDSGFGAVTMQVSGETRAPLLFRLPNADTRKLPAVERLRRPCCPSDLFENLGP